MVADPRVVEYFDERAVAQTNDGRTVDSRQQAFDFGRRPVVLHFLLSRLAWLFPERVGRQFFPIQQVVAVTLHGPKDFAAYRRQCAVFADKIFHEFFRQPVKLPCFLLRKSKETLHVLQMICDCIRV